MTQMLRHKETGELFIYTPHLAQLAELEPVIEDPVKKVVEEMATANLVDELEAELAPRPEVSLDNLKKLAAGDATAAKSKTKLDSDVEALAAKGKQGVVSVLSKAAGKK